MYILLEPVAGGLFAPFILGGAALSNYLVATLPSSSQPPSALNLSSKLLSSPPPSFPLDLRVLTAVAILVNIGSWFAQVIGHGFFERRAPALKDNLFQALFLAPLFVWLEILFACGYRPELRARVEKAVEKEVQRYHAGRKKKEPQAADGKVDQE